MTTSLKPTRKRRCMTFRRFRRSTQKEEEAGFIRVNL
jgi:hypothetical protein